MKIIASAFILLTLLSACDPMGTRGMGHESGETSAMEAMEGPGQ